ncbi:MAG: hypothetical protein ABTQ25_02695 [Nitrosomonas ureae]
MFDDRKDKLLEKLQDAHGKYYEAPQIFGGPSLYFHRKSLESSCKQDFDRFSEHIYALLTSWGMHRMGLGGAKMRGFEEFSYSLQDVWCTALRLQKKKPDSLCKSDWEDLKKVFCGIRCMATGTSLVGNSKVMAHLMPNLIPPVDRQYTLNFLFGKGQIENGHEKEWEVLSEILKEFFYPIVLSSEFKSHADEWVADPKKFPWDTSHLKIVDNLVIGYQKMIRTE